MLILTLCLTYCSSLLHLIGNIRAQILYQSCIQRHYYTHFVVEKTEHQTTQVLCPGLCTAASKEQSQETELQRLSSSTMLKAHQPPPASPGQPTQTPVCNPVSLPMPTCLCLRSSVSPGHCWLVQSSRCALYLCYPCTDKPTAELS